MKPNRSLGKSIALGLAILLGLVVYAYGVSVTKVNFEETRSEHLPSSVEGLRGRHRREAAARPACARRRSLAVEEYGDPAWAPGALGVRGRDAPERHPAASRFPQLETE